MKFHRIYSVPLNLGRHINKIEALWSENSRGLLVRVERFERSAPWTQITCATNCATPGYSVFLHDTTRGRKKQVSRVCGRRCGQARFCGSFSSGEFPPQATVPRTSGISLSGQWMGRLSSQSKRATNCATPGYSVFLHDTMRRRKKQVFRVCGRCCGHARFFGSFSTGEFPPQSTVPRTSGSSLSGEWMSRLSSQSKRATNCATPG